jgi:peroxiredoxin
VPHPAIGSQAPDFELTSQHGESFRLSRLGAPVMLVFLPLAFSPTCTGELADLRQLEPRFADAGVEICGITVDSKATLRAWADEQGVRCRLLADFWPHGEVARRYGVLREDRGYAARGSFLIDGAGVVRDAFVSPPEEARPIERYRAALDAIG